MKARVKATGEIVEVKPCGEWTNMQGEILAYRTNGGILYSRHELSFKIDDEQSDYWTRLEHQFAGMAMQGILSNNVIMNNIRKTKEETMAKIVTNFATNFAHALVEKYKKEEK